MAQNNDMKKDKEGQAVGHVAIGVPLPVRTKKESVNRKRWEAFAAEVERNLNLLRNANCQSITPMVFDEHGVLIMGFRPPEQSEQSSGFQVIPVNLQEAAQAASFSRVLSGIEGILEDSTKPENEALDDAIDHYFKRAPAEGITNFIEYAEKHCESCDDKRCSSLLPKVLERLKDQLSKRLC